MNYGSALAAAGVLSSMHRLDVAAANLANAETVAFKPDTVVTMARMPERGTAAVPGVEPKWILEKLGGGVAIAPTRPDLRQGAIKTTTRALDVALDGNGFMAVRDANGRLAFTRDGRLDLDTQGRLVMAVGGRPLLDRNGQPIQLDPARPVVIDESGTITQGEREVAQLAIMDVPATALHKVGDGLWSLDASALPRAAGRDPLQALPPAPARLMQAALEQSTVDPVTQLVDVMKATRAFQAGTEMLRQNDATTRRSIEAFGRFA